MNRRAALLAVAAGLAMGTAACSGASPAAAPPGAWALAAKLPGCSPSVLTGSQMPGLARQALSCNGGQFAGAEIATFGRQQDARTWYAVNTEFLRVQETGRAQAPLGVMGSGWAVVLPAVPAPGEAQTIQHYLGGGVAR